MAIYEQVCFFLWASMGIHGQVWDLIAKYGFVWAF